MSRAPLNPVPTISEPFKKIAIDLIGELPKTKTGYKYVLTLIDYGTRYPEAIPLKTTHSRVIAEALISVFSRVGLPNEIVSDQGSNLIGQLMRQLYELLGISHIKTSVYHPEANGLVKRFNGTLKHMLKKFVANQIDNWDKYLPHVLFAYREVPCQSTGYSPFELLYGRSVRGPFSLIKETWVRKESLPKDAISYVLEVRRRLSQMQSIVHENTKKSQAKQKKLYDQKSSHRKFQIGDKVLVLLPTPGSKLESKWQGPYTVTNVCTNGLNYELDREKGRKQKRTYHINLLKLWKTREEMKLSTTEKECLAIVWAVETFRYYLFGRKFILQTDHNPLVWLNQVKNKNRKLLRWSLTLQEYDIELEHKCGEKHVNVDAVSRMP
ncbi:Retrovirus-related Pol poly from transposon [Paramuricea clavata]|uniref:Retrovirus-related Pol poly from transposon n=1 Tax=Paramuricea clavata TaxID=317549 RepID=A0A6S7I6G1_PARCT|nr:Retrovirus-related Pol poly from transposon [Paramuricea clavata]